MSVRDNLSVELLELMNANCPRSRSRDRKWGLLGCFMNVSTMSFIFSCLKFQQTRGGQSKGRRST